PSSINRAKRSRNSIGNGAGMINPPKKGEPQIMSQGNPADSNFYRNALSQAVQTILLWSDTAFDDQPPLAMIDGNAVLRPEIADVIRAAYDQVMPAMDRDASHALRLQARITRPS
ncbi:hypothetical protein ACEWPN_21965, partial [Yoonia sp. R2-816]